METYPLKNAVAISHLLAMPYISRARVLVDMTCGNGHDTCFLASHMDSDAVLYAFDIQQVALDKTTAALKRAGLMGKNIILRRGSHDELVQDITEPLDMVFFNLGYLPSGEHEIHTKREITIKAVNLCLNKIAINGIIMIAAYPGTEAGADEENALRQYLSGIRQDEFHVSTWRPVNQIHCPPVLYIVQKRG